MKNIRIPIFRPAILIVLCFGWAFADNDRAPIYRPPSYDSFTPPVAGESYGDPVFGTRIERLSDAAETRNTAGKGPLQFVSVEYATMSPFNQNNTRLLLQHQSYFALYDTRGRHIRDLPHEIQTSSEPRWSRHDADVLYYLQGNQLKEYNASTGRSSLVRRFSEYKTISGKGESDISFDGDHFVFLGDNRHVFVYQISTGRKLGVFDTGGRAFDSLYVTPDNNVTITWKRNGAGRYRGIELFDRDMNFLRQVARAGGHMDVTRDVDGEEILVWANAADPTPICNNGIVKIRLSDGHQTCLISLDWGLATHTSAPDNSGWVFVGTYAPSNPAAGGYWPAYTNEVLQIKLDGSEIRRLAHHRSRPFDSYNWTPRVSTSRDGTMVAYNSNYGQQAARPLAAEYVDAYLIRIDPETRGSASRPAVPRPAPEAETGTEEPDDPKPETAPPEPGEPARGGRVGTIVGSLLRALLGL